MSEALIVRPDAGHCACLWLYLATSTMMSAENDDDGGVERSKIVSFARRTDKTGRVISGMQMRLDVLAFA